MEKLEIKTPVAKKAVDNKKLPTTLHVTGLNELSPSPASISPEEPAYTESPDGKYKFFIKSEQDSDYLDSHSTNIPAIKIPGWVVVWPHDVKPDTIHNMQAKGYQFVRETDPGCSAAGRIIHAGLDTAGKPARHYAMKIPEAKFKELKAREEKIRQELEGSLQVTPSKDTNQIYGTQEMQINNELARKMVS